MTDEYPDAIPDTQIRVRSAYPEDSLAVHQIIDEVAATGSVLPRDIEDIDLWIESFVVGTVNGDIVACAALNTVGTPRIGEIRSVAVSSRARGTGLGRAVMEYLVDEARSLGLERLFLLTRIPAFFEKCGFNSIDVEKLPDSFIADLVHIQKRSLFNKFVMTRDFSLIADFINTHEPPKAAATPIAARTQSRSVQPGTTPDHTAERVA